MSYSIALLNQSKIGSTLIFVWTFQMKKGLTGKTIIFYDRFVQKTDKAECEH